MRIFILSFVLFSTLTSFAALASSKDEFFQSYCKDFQRILLPNESKYVDSSTILLSSSVSSIISEFAPRVPEERTRVIELPNDQLLVIPEAPAAKYVKFDHEDSFSWKGVKRFLERFDMDTADLNTSHWEVLRSVQNGMNLIRPLNCQSFDSDLLKVMLYFQEIGAEIFGNSTRLIATGQIIDKDSFAVLNEFYDIYRLDVVTLEENTLHRVIVEFKDYESAVKSLTTYLLPKSRKKSGHTKKVGSKKS